MFLSTTLSQNPRLAEYAVDLHQKGIIRPNTYVLDLDTISENAAKLAETARNHGIKLYMMTKQVGRNPKVAQAVADSIPSAVAVDPWEALHLARAGIPLGHVGHLVQIPSSMVEAILDYQPEVITVFSLAKAREISKVARARHYQQDLLLKVTGEGDLVYEGQWGGFREEEWISAAREIEGMPGVRIAGVTAFPCLLYDGKEIAPTPNFQTLVRAARTLEEALDRPLDQMNAPSATACASLSLLKSMGATHGEPGHALTGTTPLHEHPGQPEQPAIVYISEVSHREGDIAYAYGGGHYRRSRMRQALIGRNLDEMMNRKVPILELSPEVIDYTIGLRVGEMPVEVGETVLFAFRTQIFVTRSEVAVVSGLQAEKPQIQGIYNHLGESLC
ncbi:putative amino acid racemase [Kroppenstedtia sanguinis]|uniref:alanine racemase n=1 Tax=Kroppenstedtia sanguinis TaxID=1380684 RepID=UPI003D20BAB2